MAYSRPKESAKQLESDVKKVIRLASRKSGVTAEQIVEAIGIPKDFMSYWYRTVIVHARKNGLKREGAGRGSVWRA